MKRAILFFSSLILLTGIVSAQDYYMGVSTDNCNTCHATEITAWMATGHAKAHDSLATQAFFKGYCLPCHNTGWNDTLNNYGADEYVNIAPDQSWTIADETNFNRVKNVQCEACHGPVGKDDRTLDFGHTAKTTDFSSDNCGVCHEGTHHPYYSEWSASAHASGAPVWLNRNFAGGSCMYCHYAQDFIAFLEDENYNGGSFTPEGSDVIITCITCHDPHGNDNPGNLRFAETGKSICDVCHTVHTDTVDVTATPHHTTSEVLSGAANFGYQYPGETYQNSIHTLAANERCINCHVYMTPYVSEEEPAGTGHTFLPRVEACVECHTDYYTVVDTSNHDHLFDYRGIQTEIMGLMETLEGKLAQATSADSTTDAFLQALYNFNAIEAEGSHGIHNTKLVRKLLQDAIARFDPSDVELDDGIPVAYALQQNFPNPFNPTTEIKFSLPEKATVKLIIYDMLGNKIATLIDEELGRGNYNAKWNAADYASGVYLYRLQTDQFVRVKKMLLLK